MDALNQGDLDPRVSRLVRGLVLIFVIVIAVLVATLALQEASLVRQPLFLVAVPAGVIFGALLLSTASGFARVHAAVLVWTTVLASWSLALIDFFLSEKAPTQEATAIGVMLGAVLLRRVAFAWLLAAVMIVAITMNLALPVTMEVARSNILFATTASLAGGMMWWVLALERTLKSDAIGKLSRSNSHLEDLLQSAEEAIITTDEEHRIQLYNHQAEQWAEQYFGRSIHQGRALRVVLPVVLHEGFDSLQLQTDSSRVWRFSWGDKPSWFEATAAPLQEGGGFIFSIRDVTKVEEARALALNAHDKVRREVMNLVSHEISTPLTPVLLTTARLLRNADKYQDEDLRRALEMMQRDVQRAIHAVHEIREANERERTAMARELTGLQPER